MLDEIRKVRIEKLNKLKKAGMEPYPISSRQDFTLVRVLDDFIKLGKRKTAISLVGRVLAMREHGGSLFCDFSDGTGQLQAYLKKDIAGEKLFSLFKEAVDVGDFLEFQGKLFTTKKKEKSLEVVRWRMLAKSLRPLPEKWHGLQDVEERFRKRYLDLLMNKDIKERFLLRSKIITEMRSFLDKEGFVEVETPILQPLAGGAAAAPFVTHHNALDIDLYLRIAPELYLKRLLVGGFSKVYEIGRNFRNEGIDATHNPEFTMLEFYDAYSDAEKLRAFIESMFKNLMKNIFQKTSISYEASRINFSKKFATISYFDLFKRHALITKPQSATRDDLSLKAKQFGIGVEDFETKEKILDNIYKKICRPKLIQPTFIINYPKETSPFAKKQPKEEGLIDRFQLVAGGAELVNAFSELNDPLDQRQRFLEQDKKKKQGEEEVSVSDEAYLEAMEYGMPPAGGVGIGIDRLVMLFTDTKNIKEVLFFPTMKPKNS